MPTFDEYNKAAQKYTLEAQARDPEWQAWQSNASMYSADMGGAPASPNKDYTAEYFGSLSPEQQREYWQQYEQHQADKAKSWQSKVAGVMKFIPAAVGAAGLAGATGLLGGGGAAAPTLGSTVGGSGSMLGGGLGGTGSGLGVAGLTAPSTLAGTGGGLAASNAAGWLPTLGAGAAGLSGLSGEGGNLISSLAQTGLGPAGSNTGTGNPIADFFQGLSGSGTNKGGFNFPNTLAGLFDAYSAYSQGKKQGDLADSLMGLFKPGGDYSEELRRQLERRDAQAGRRSQYGPREVELQAKLAGMAANSATSASNIYNQQGAFQDRTLSSGLDVLNSSGAMSGLSRLFAPAAAAGG